MKNIIIVFTVLMLSGSQHSIFAQNTKANILYSLIENAKKKSSLLSNNPYLKVNYVEQLTIKSPQNSLKTEEIIQEKDSLVNTLSSDTLKPESKQYVQQKIDRLNSMIGNSYIEYSHKHFEYKCVNDHLIRRNLDLLSSKRNVDGFDEVEVWESDKQYTVIEYNHNTTMYLPAEQPPFDSLKNIYTVDSDNFFMLNLFNNSLFAIPKVMEMIQENAKQGKNSSNDLKVLGSKVLQIIVEKGPESLDTVSEKYAIDNIQYNNRSAIKLRDNISSDTDYNEIIVDPTQGFSVLSIQFYLNGAISYELNVSETSYHESLQQYFPITYKVRKVNESQEITQIIEGLTFEILNPNQDYSSVLKPDVPDPSKVNLYDSKN